MKSYLFAFLFCSIGLWGKPSGFESIAGGATYHIDTKGAHVIQSGSQAIVHWDTFSLGKGELVNFLQKDSQSAILNRVMGGSLSKIHGHIVSNGKVFLINRAGVMIGPEATIKCAGFLASTANISDEVFLSGKGMHFKEYGEGEIVNLGTISSPSGDVLLLAKRVEHLGSIYAKTVILAADTEVLLKPEGPIFIQSTLDTTLKTTDPYAIAMKMEGEVIAQKLNNQGGKIFLVSDTGKTEVNGVLTTSGGTIHVLGEEVTICEKAQIDVSSDHGAGEILIGGDYQGKNPAIKNASRTTAHEGAEIHADSYCSGDGGKIILWSDGNTVCDATLSAKSYGKTGAGGFIEVSGKESIAISTHPDLRAKSGEYGTFLMDAGPITIDSSLSGGPSTFGDSFIITQLGSGNYTIDTGNAPGPGAETITITGGTNITWSDATYLELIAGQNIVMLGGTTIRNNHATANNKDAIRMTAKGVGSGGYSGIAIRGTLQSAGRNIRLTGTGGDSPIGQNGVSIEVGGMVSTTNGGNIFFDGTGGPGTGTSNHGIFIKGSGKVTTTSGNISLRGFVGGASGNDHYGIFMADSAQVASTGGRIFFLGDARPSTSTGEKLRGISMENLGTAISNTTGDIVLNGWGSPTGNAGCIGILFNGTSATTTSGNITVTGVGGGSVGGGGNGIQLVQNSALISSSSGKIILDGTGSLNGSTLNNHGVLLNSSSNVTNGSGDIILTGVGGREGIGRCTGVFIEHNVSTTGGRIAIGGTAGGVSGDFNSGVEITDMASVTAPSSIAISGRSGPSAPSSFGVNINTVGTNVSAGADLQMLGLGGFGSENGILIQQATVTGSGSITGKSFSDIILNEGATIVSAGPINLTSSRDLIIQGGNAIATDTTVTSGGDLALIAGRNLSFLNGTMSLPIVTSGVNMALVTDNQFSTFTDRGPGRLLVQSDALITAAGELRVYTVQQSQNTIKTTLNGGTFTPGPFGVDTNTEKWILYFPDGSYGGPFFTIYYKIGEYTSDSYEISRALGQFTSLLPTLQFGQLPSPGFTRPYIYHGHYCPCPSPFAPYRAFIFEDDIFWTDNPVFDTNNEL